MLVDWNNRHNLIRRQLGSLRPTIRNSALLLIIEQNGIILSTEILLHTIENLGISVDDNHDLKGVIGLRQNALDALGNTS